MKGRFLETAGGGVGLSDDGGNWPLVNTFTIGVSFHCHLEMVSGQNEALLRMRIYQ